MPPPPRGVARNRTAALGVLAAFATALWLLVEANASGREIVAVFLLPVFALLMVGVFVTVRKRRGRRASGGGEVGWESDGGDTSEGSGHAGGFGSDASSACDSGSGSDGGGSSSES